MGAILAIDTSSSLSSICLRTDTGNLFEDEIPNCDRHDGALVGRVSKLFTRAGITPGDLTNLVCGSGPGSFTGLRISLSFLKGISISLKIPLSTVSTFHAIATSSNFLGRVVCLGDAGRKELFYAAYEVTGSGAVELSAEEIIPAMEVSTRIDHLAQGSKLEVLSLPSQTTEIFNESAPQAKPATHIARGLISAGTIGKNKQFSLADTVDAAPRYLRSVSAKTIAERRNAT